ncbi:MAG: acetyl-CoA carboxylase biotin carboxylase subunit [Spirochaetia bacterium]
MIASLFIANRGEIAVRIIRACREMGIRSVIGYSEADKESLGVRMADEAVCIGASPSRLSYLNISNLVSAALLTGCDAVHPGVGFLAENSPFAKAVEDAGLIFIGPAAETISLLGDKVQAKRSAAEYKVPVIPGSEGSVENPEKSLQEANEIGFPVIVKAAAGGGGKGMRIVREEKNFLDILKVASTEAEAAFSDGTVYLEKYLENPRHVEIQILSDGAGNVIHLGERDCSAQFNHQKLVEESPSPGVNPAMRKSMGDAAVRLFKGLGYIGAGTIEFLVSGDEYYFMEVNARVQVEHPVTEMVTGVDIIREQILVCTGETLKLNQDEISLKGCAVECRINARKPGKVSSYLPPGGFMTRMDSHLYTGYTVPPYYDALIGKLIVWAAGRDLALKRMDRALTELDLQGVETNIEEQQKIIRSKIFRSGNFGTDMLSHVLKEGT